MDCIARRHTHTLAGLSPKQAKEPANLGARRLPIGEARRIRNERKSKTLIQAESEAVICEGIMDLARPMLESLVHEVTGVKVLSMHHDISTVTAEEVVVFSLAGAPRFQ
jgi:Na+-translocating membrane potential-generating system MpsC-like protein